MQPPVERRAPRGAEDELARVQVELAARAAGATPLSELEGTSRRDVSRIQPVLQQLLTAATDLLRTEMAAVWVADSEVGELYAVAWTGLPDEYMTGLRVPVGEGTAGRTVAARAPVRLDDVATDPDYTGYRDEALEHGIRSVLSVPMTTLTGDVLGALSVYFPETGRTGEAESRLAQTLARQAGEMVERARMHAEARTLAGLERRRGEQLRGLADAALALTAADTLDDLLRLTTEAAVSVVGCHQGVATRLPHGWADATTYVALSEKYAAWRDYDVVPQGLGVLEYVVRENTPLRLTGDELVRHPDWRGLRDAPDHPPLPDYLAAPFLGRDGRNLGLLQLSHKVDDTPFTEADEAIVVQLSQMVSFAIERLEALEGERAARQEAEEAARIRGLLSDASAAFSASLEPAEVGEQLVAVVVPRLADIAVLHLVDERGELRLETLLARDAERTAQVRDWVQGGAAIDPQSPWGAPEVVRTGRPQVLPEVTDEVLQGIAATPADLEGLRRIAPRSGVVVPLIARGRTLGALSLSRDEPYDERDVEYAVDLARRAALALDNASRYAFERELAATLQRSLLPREMPTSALLTSAARYLPGARGTQIGGDWYDLLEVDDGFVLVVGDVMGRGVHAASVMGQLRSSVRAFALEGHPPARVLGLLERVVAGMDVNFTTCLVGHLDATTRTLCIAAAGHLSPLVVGPDGHAAYLDLDPGLPLGVGGGDFVEREVVLAPGSAVLLFTDGLVEESGEPIDEGLARLRAGLDVPVGSAEELCDRALRVMGRDGDHDDDTALLALVLDAAGEAATSLELALPATAESAGAVREALLSLLAATGHDELADTAALLVTELVANTVRHVGGTVRVRAGVRGGLLLVEVADEHEALPRARADQPWEAESGRGLLLVQELADRWGADPLPTGKRVWFELGAGG